MRKKLYKKQNGAIFLGVLNGASEYLDIDVSILRLLTIILTFTTAFFPVLITYIIMGYILPDKSSIGFNDYTID